MRIVLVGLSVACAATTFGGVDDDFSEALRDRYWPAFGDARQLLIQQNDRMEFHNGSVVDESLGSVMLVSSVFRPRYDQSWNASLEVTVPSSYDNLGPSPGSSQFVHGGIAAIFAPDDAFDSPGTQYFVSTLEVGREAPESDIERVLTLGDRFSNVVRRPTELETVRIDIRFDSLSRSLRALANDNELFAVTIDGSRGVDWGMSDSDQFYLGLLGEAEYVGVAALNPVTLDNFRAALVVPEASAAALLAAWGVAAPRRRGG